MLPTTQSKKERSPRDIARLTGVLWIITFITASRRCCLRPAAQRHQLHHRHRRRRYPRLLGASLELLLIVANIGTAVVPYSIYKRYDEPLALGFVTARIMESAFIAVGIVSVLAIVTLRQDLGGTTSDGTLLTIGQVARRRQGADLPARPGLRRRPRQRPDLRVPHVPPPACCRDG